MVATAAQLARTASDNCKREWRVSIGPPRSEVTELAFRVGEPASIPTITYVTGDMLPGETAIAVSDTSAFASAGTLIVAAETSRAGWWSYTGKGANSFTGVALLQGEPLPRAGETVSAWASLGAWPPIPQSATQRLAAAPVLKEYRDGPFYDWECEITGVYFDRRLFRDDATVLVEERVSPEGHPEYFTDWMVSAVGYVRRWDVTVDARRNNPWKATVRSIKAYLDITRWPATTYGRVELLEGTSVSADAELANPEDEIAEFQGGLGTTAPENVVDENNNTLYISQLAPTSTAETPGSSGGSDPGVQVEEVFRGDAQSPNLIWIMLRLAADSPHYDEDGQNLHNFALTNKQTVFVESGQGDSWPMELQAGGGENYIRLHSLSVNDTNDILILTNNGAAFRSRYNVNSTVQVVDYRFLDGFRDDHEPGRDFTLTANDWVQLRFVAGKESVRSMVVWGTHTGEPWWNNTPDEVLSEGTWSDPPADVDVTWTTANTSIRRVPVSYNTNSPAAFAEETRPNPADRRTDTDEVYLSAEVPEFSVNLTGNITDVSPASGANLTVTDATWFDLTGVIKIDAEEIAYRGRDATTFYNITRAANGTVAAAHTMAALVYQVGEWVMINQALPQYISATDPATGGDLYLGVVSGLDAGGGTLLIHSEQIAYTTIDADSAVNITRGANNTTAANHVPRTPIYHQESDLGATRLPIVAQIEWRRWLRQTAAGLNIVPERFDLYGSTTATPLYPGDDNWEFDWLDGAPLKEITGNLATSGTIDIIPPMRLKHVLLYFRKMSDDGRAKLNTLRAWRKQLDDGANDETGAGVAVRDGLERVLTHEEIAIVAGAFDGTSGDITTAEASVSEVLADLLTENFCMLRCERDGSVTVFRDPLHPLGLRVEVDAAFTAAMMRSPMTTHYPSRVGADQIVVELYDARTGDVFEGRYPAGVNNLNVKRVTLRRAAGSQEAANNAAARLYFTQPEISREFTFTTSGAAEWLTAGMRLIVTDFSDDERPGGVAVNTLVQAVTHEQAEEVTVQEWRAL
jgi:hypothetical protein